MARELNKVIATLRTALVGLGEVAEVTGGEWLCRESVFVCGDNPSNQIESLARPWRKIERAQESNPDKLALIE